MNDTFATSTPHKNYFVPVGLALLALLAVTAGFALGGEAARFMAIGVQLLPLAVLAMLAYAGLKNAVAALFSYVWLAVIAFAVVFNALSEVLLVYAQPGLLDMTRQSAASALSLQDLLKPGAGAALLWTVLLLFVVGLIAASMLLRPVRIAVSHIMPVDPDNFVHKIALCILTLIFLSSFVPLIVLGGRPPILELITNTAGQNLAQGSGLSVRPVDLIYQFVWTIPAVLLAAGWPIVRTFRATLARLGMVRPSTFQVVGGLALGFTLAVVSSLLIDPAINWLWTTLGWPVTNVAAFNSLLSSVTTPLGAVLVGVTAGIGEEMAVRGLLQPRIGLIASNLFFTSLHAYQYGVDALLSVFIVGTILGVIRARSNTSTSAIVHGTYNFVLVLAAALAIGQ